MYVTRIEVPVRPSATIIRDKQHLADDARTSLRIMRSQSTPPQRAEGTPLAGRDVDSGESPEPTANLVSIACIPLYARMVKKRVMELGEGGSRLAEWTPFADALRDRQFFLTWALFTVHRRSRGEETKP